MFPSLHLSGKDVEGDGKIVIIDTSNCWSTLYQKPKFKSIDVQKTSERPNADRERKTHISYFTKFFFFLFHRTKEPVTLPPNHVVEHRITRTDVEVKDGKKVLLEETAVAHVNPL